MNKCDGNEKDCKGEGILVRLNSFYVTYNMEKRGLSSLFKRKIFNIYAEERTDWDYISLQ